MTKQNRNEAAGRTRKAKRGSASSKKKLLLVEIVVLAAVVLLAGTLLLGNRGENPAAVQQTGEPAGTSQQAGDLGEEEVYDTSMEALIMARYRENALLIAGMDNTAWISNGRLKVIGRDDFGQCETAQWKNIAAAAYHNFASCRCSGKI